MIRFLTLIFIFLASCSSQNIVKDYDFNLIYSDDMSFDEFRIKIEEYTKKSPYPNIDD